MLLHLEDLKAKIIPFFNKFKLYGKKRFDFVLWRETVNILYKYKLIKGKMNIKKGVKGFIKTPWKKENLNRLIEIKNEMAAYKSKKSQEAKWLYIAEKQNKQVREM